MTIWLEHGASAEESVDKGADQECRLVVHLIVLGDKGLFVLVLLSGFLGIETGLRKSLSGGVVDARTTTSAAPTGVDNGGRVNLFVVVLLHASNASASQ